MLVLLGGAFVRRSGDQGGLVVNGLFIGQDLFTMYVESEDTGINCEIMQPIKFPSSLSDLAEFNK
jgi:hypothetical protein